MICTNCGLEIHFNEPVVPASTQRNEPQWNHYPYRCILLLKKRIEFLEKEIKAMLVLA